VSAGAEVRVCPRCGDAAGEHRYCQTCGLNLRQQAGLPTRAEWEHRQGVAAEPTTPPDAAVPERPAPRPESSVRPGALPDEFSVDLLKEVIPLAKWLDDPPWKGGWTRWFVVFAIAPLVFLAATGNSPDPRGIAWAFAIYFAVVWALVLWLLIRPERPSVEAVGLIVLFGLIVGVPLAAWLERQIGAGDLSNPLSAIFGVGLPEEAVKLLPVAAVAFWLAPQQGHQYSPLTYLFLGALSGLAVGVNEGANIYTDVNIGGLVQTGDFTGFIGLETLRLVTDSLSHGIWAGISGYFLGLAILFPRSRGPLIAIGLGLATGLHGLFDWSTTQGAWLPVAIELVSILVFVAYVRTGEELSDRLRRFWPDTTPGRTIPPRA
jgi:RsiW-degrading membrane proteinase PrsW (M82 family)